MGDMAEPDEGKKELFRVEALGAVGGRNRLNTLSPIVEPRLWILTATLAFLLATVVVWSFAGRIPITVIGSGIFLRGEQLDTCNAHTSGYIASIDLPEGATVVAGQRIASLAGGSADAAISEVRAPKAGRLVSLESESGDFVESGQSIALVISGAPHPSCLAFIPLSEGKSVVIGMPVRVSFASADSAGDVQSLGTIVQVDHFITSKQKALGHVPSHTIVEEILGTFGSVMAVTVKLDEDPDGAGGVKWVGGKGAAGMLVDGAPCNIEIYIGEIRPVALVMPGFGGGVGDER
ncbi:MAG: hypothetical protein EXS03_07575 [Phycisphaerales bacterium]|nr:hypothetical protein [Phycisphaerales bacterium]